VILAWPSTVSAVAYFETQASRDRVRAIVSQIGRTSSPDPQISGRPESGTIPFGTASMTGQSS